MPESDEGFMLHPILTIVQLSLGEVLAKIRMPALPVRSSGDLQAPGASAEITDTDAYIINSLPAAVWGQCMIGLDFMQGLRATIASDSYFSAHALARAAIESFAFGFWVCDDRLTMNERYHRALQLNREFVRQERRRCLRAIKLAQPERSDDLAQALDDRLKMIESGIAHFAQQLDKDGISYATKLPTKTEVVTNILADVSPIPDGLYGTMSAVVHSDAIFAYGLLSPHPHGERPPASDDLVLLSSSITNHLTPAWHALAAMCISVGVARSTLEIDCDMDAMSELTRDVMGFIAHNGDQPIWYRGDAKMSEVDLHSLDWYLEAKA